MRDFFCIDNFFNEEEMQTFERACSESTHIGKYQHPYGIFANQLIGDYSFIDNPKEYSIDSWLNPKIESIYNLAPDEYDIPVMYLSKLYLPWDIHTDLHLETSKPNFFPYYQLLIPFEDVESRTMVFDQASEDTNDFFKYKEQHGKVDNPIDEEFWNANLSMCWPEDRLYCSLKQAMPYQRRGQLQSWRRKYFHSSDNFHIRGITSKSFLTIRLDIRKDLPRE